METNKTKERLSINLDSELKKKKLVVYYLI